MKKGFTLIELLVVVLIIGILSAIALPQYTQAVEKSRAAEALSNIGSFSRAVEIWKLANPDKHRCFTGNCYGVGELDINIPDDWVQGTSAMVDGHIDANESSCSKNFCYSIDTNFVKAIRRSDSSSTYGYKIGYDLADKTYHCDPWKSNDSKFCRSLAIHNIGEF